ncbi:hypothetical protein RhiJN_22706 [Ceratobasidium sp. AG-Ba]|nr:hypothetical protein RhiJN_22706 [Ceratobasidium sp. AG-Ba]
MQSKLIDALERLGPSGFSELDNARVAAELRLVSRVAMLRWEGRAPPVVVRCGDVGYITGANTEKLAWDAIVTNRAVDTYYHSSCSHSDPCVTNDYFSDVNFRNEDWKKTLYGRWIGVEITTNAPLSCICWTSPVRDSSSRAAGERARDALVGQDIDTIDIDRACYCDYISCTVQVDRSKYEMAALGPLYFHRNPSSSDSRMYWGFLSTSTNPDCSEAVISEAQSILKYDIRFHMVCLLDMWEYKYNRMLQEELDSMPGSYPDDGTGKLSSADHIVRNLGFNGFRME